MPAVSEIWLRLRGQRQVAAGMAGARGGVAALQRQTDLYNQSVRHAERRTFLMNQALFTLRRFTFYATVGLGAAATAAANLGFQFNMAMETNTVAMGHLLGSEQAARQELDLLYELAAKTPFEFANVTEAARRFLAFGFSLDETNEALRVVGDTASALGGDPAENIARLVLVLGQVRATGRVLGQDMLQLQQLGINTNKIFQEQLGITQEQLFAGVGNLQIPSEVAIPALLRGMNEQFEGMAAQQAVTMRGLLSTMHDYTAQLFGAITEPAFESLRDDVLPDMIDLVNTLSAAAKEGATTAELIGIIDDKIGAIGLLSQTFETLAGMVAIFGNILTEIVIPALQMSAVATYPVWFVLAQVVDVLGFVTDKSDLLAIALGLLITSMVYTRAVMVTLWLWNLRLAVAWGINFFWVNRNAWAFRFLWGRIVAVTLATRAWLFASVMARSSLGTFTGKVLVHNGILARTGRAIWLVIGATRAWVVANIILRRSIFNIPVIGWILAIIAGLIILEQKFGLISKTVRGIWDLFIRFKAWVTGNAISWDDFLPDVNLPGGGPNVLGKYLHSKGVPSWLVGMADGGRVTMGGAFLVGERGPELAMLPAGSAVTPIDAGFKGEIGGMPEYILVKTDINIDGRQVGEATSKYRLDRKARR